MEKLIPRRPANGRAVAVTAGFAAEVLVGQLVLLEREMIHVADAVSRNDVDRLLAHGRFLADRFGHSELQLQGPQPG